MKATGYRQLKSMRLHFMGIGGSGISAVAQMALQAGAVVSGCDRASSATTEMLAQLGIPVQIGHSAEHLAEADALIYVPAAVAYNPNNPELLAARARGLLVMTWQEMLGQWLEGYCLLSVSGVHGKGTTTAMLALALVEAGLDPTCEIGAVVRRFGANYRIGQSSYFVNEADEFNNNFWHYHPRLAVVTSIEFEHPEFFADYGEYLASFEHFVRGMDLSGDWPFPPTLILNAGSPGCLELRQRIPDLPVRILTYAVEGEQPVAADFLAYDLCLDGETSFKVRARSGPDRQEERVIHLRLPGAHNVENALASLVAATSAGVEAAVAVAAIERFEGTRRRFELRNEQPLTLGGKTRDVMLVDDYAHHPTAITRTLEAARRRYPGRRLVAVYQPHMYSRTKTFFEQFLTAFDDADEVVIVDIYPGREEDTGLVHARDLVSAMREHPHFAQAGVQVLHGGSVRETTELLRECLRDGDLVIMMGAGDIYRATEVLLHDSTANSVKFDAEQVYQELLPRYPGRVRRNELLARHGTFGVGGPADVWVTLETTEELLNLVRLCVRRAWPLLLVGNGTNVLYADAGARGVVARLALNEYTIEEQGEGNALLVAGAGVSWPRLLNELATLGWGGLEFGPGIPGTLGGGVVSNAGAHFGNLGEVLEWVEVVDARPGTEHGPVERRYEHAELDMGYRHSRFRQHRRISFDDQGRPVVASRELVEPGEIITRLGVRLHRADPQELRAKIEEFKLHRKRTQPPQQSAGSVFKNPAGDYAARLIEQAGLKGTAHGKARISERHANFIVNAGGASAADVVALIVEARTRVREQFGVDLELEVELRGAWEKTNDE